MTIERDEELRKLAESAYGGNWYSDPELYKALRNFITADYANDDAAFIAAASPDVVLGLLDRIKALEQDHRDLFDRAEKTVAEITAERDEAREAVRLLAGFLENIQGNTRQDVVRWDCESALADPIVKRIVEEK